MNLIVVNEVGSQCAYSDCRERSVMQVRTDTGGEKDFAHGVCLEHGEFYLAQGYKPEGGNAQLEIA